MAGVLVDQRAEIDDLNEEAAQAARPDAVTAVLREPGTQADALAGDDGVTEARAVVADDGESILLAPAHIDPPGDGGDDLIGTAPDWRDALTGVRGWRQWSPELAPAPRP